MHTTSQTQASGGSEASVLASLRRLLPNRRISLAEALVVAELVAQRLLVLRGVTELPVPSDLVTTLPRIVVEPDADLPRHAASGSSDWDNERRVWVIATNPDEPATRQRFTTMHEFWHIVTHYHPGLGGSLPKQIYGLDPVEYVAEYFAGCLLMPKRWLKAAYHDGIQRPSDLAELFTVSTRAMEVRMAQIGLTKPPRDTVPNRQFRRQTPRSASGYRRATSRNWLTTPRVREIA